MKTQRNRMQVWGVIVLVTMLLSLFSPAQTVFADDTPPPADSSEVVDAPSEAETVSDAETPVVEASAVEEAPTEEPVSEVQATEAAPTEEASVGNEATILNQLPENTDLAVLNAEGELVPLVSQEAVSILADPDPFLYFGGVKKAFTAADCDPDTSGNQACSNPIQRAIDYAKTHAPDDGTVYIEKGTYNETVTIADFTVALTLQGVLNANGDLIINPADRPVINGRILLVDGPDNEPGTDYANRANITLADLIINDNNTGGGDNPAIYADRNTAGLTFINLDINAPSSGNSGLVVTSHSGSVTLINVDASGTANDGANIDNTAGTGDIEVVKSTFNNNSSDGLVANSNGNITLVNVTAQNNGGDGAYLGFPNAGTHTVTICGGVFSGQSGGGDYNVQVSNGDIRNRSSGILVTNWSPSTGWGTASCNYTDADGDQIPDQWDTDDDNDGVSDAADLCPGTPTGEPVDANGCSAGQLDSDNDGVPDAIDNCPSVSNANQANADGDGFGDVCDPFPNDPNNDADGDGYGADVDNCPNIANPTQADTDNDGLGDVCDAFPNDPNNDADGDGIGGDVDNCPAISNSTQTDTDNDGLGDVCDPFPNDPNNDADGDGIGGNIDNCPSIANPAQTDTDNDGLGDVCDPFPNDPNNDADGDGVGSDVDNCPNIANPTQADSDNDGLGDVCDPFPNDPNNDADSDGVGGDVDNCPNIANPTQTDSDNDGAGDVCDPFPNDPNDDVDGDGVSGEIDNCPNVANPTQTDTDEDGLGDACDSAPNGETNISCPVGTTWDGESCATIICPFGLVLEGNTCVDPNAGGNGAGVSTVYTSAIVPPTGVQPTELSCSTANSVLQMAGFEVTFAGLCGYSTLLNEALENNLIAPLPDGNAFVGGIDITLLQDGLPINTLPAGTGLTLSFDLPVGMTSETLAVLYWDPAANGASGGWVEKSISIENGKVLVTLDGPGTFVLVDKSAASAQNGSSPTVAQENGIPSMLVNFFKGLWQTFSASFN